MFVSPPSGRAQPRASLMRTRALSLLALLAILTAAFALGAGDDAAAKKKKKKDKKAPYVTKAITVDADSDGKVDGVILNYSEKIRITKIKTGKGKVKKKNKKKIPWKSARQLGTVKVLSGAKSISVQLAEGDAADSAERSIVSYIRVPKGAKGVVDQAGNSGVDRFDPRRRRSSTCSAVG